MKQFYFALCFLISLVSSAQIIFENGYMVTNNGEKNQVLIKNEGWRTNPEEFKYKSSENSNVQTGTIESVKEFGITNGPKYIRAKIMVDRSSNEIAEMSEKRSPEFQEEISFLKTLVEGKASLYLYQQAGFRRYFYSIGDGEIIQLIYKKYRPKGKAIATNNRYKQQLLNHLSCDGFSEITFKKIDYTERDLSKFFIKYNNCQGANYVEYSDKKQYDFFNLSIRPGASLSSFRFDNNRYRRSGGFDNQWNFRIGIEAEFVLPFNKNKWAFFIEPSYASPIEQEFMIHRTDKSEQRPITMNYQAIDIPVGIRYYLFFNPQSKLFVDGAFVFNYSLDSKIQRTTFYDKALEINSGGGYFVAGLGYKFNDYSVEVRYNFTRSLLDHYSYTSDYERITFIVGYTIF